MGWNKLGLSNWLRIATKTVHTAAGNVTWANDGVLIVNKTSGAATGVTISAPETRGGIFYMVKDGKGDAETNNITVTPESGTIDGQASYVLSKNYGWVWFYDDGTNYHVVAEEQDAEGPIGAGTVAGTGVSVVESGDNAVHKTTFTLASAVIPVTSTTTANGFGGLKIYDFPQGHVRILGCTASLSLSVDAAKQADFTDGTPEGDIGIGSVIIANADAFGTDATDDDMGTGAAFTMSAFVDSDIDIPPEAAANFDGTTTPLDANVNVLVDAADIDDDATTEVEVTGTVTIVWSFLGDY